MGNKVFLIIGLLVLLTSVPLAIILLTRPTVFNLRASNQTNPENVLVQNVTDQGAAISWQTTAPSQASLKYGLNPQNLSLVYAEAAKATTHQAKLEALLPDSDYFFAFQIGTQIYSDPSYKFHTLPRNANSTGGCATEEQLKAALGTENAACDLNHDGVVNSVDLLLFRKQNQ
jgi:hypothetical protein